MVANLPAEAQSISDLKARAEAERASRPFLLYRDGEDRQRFFFLDHAPATVGRRPPSDLLLEWDDQVSRRHARLELVEGAWELADDGPSRNGTFVNGKRLSGRCRLSDRDILRFGATTVTFRSPDREQAGTGLATRIPVAASLSTSQRRVLVALCRPYKGRSGFASPATEQQIADELFVTVGAVKTHLRVLQAKLGVEELPHGETRVRLVERAFSAGLISERDL